MTVDRTVQERPVVEHGSDARVAEDFRRIRTNLQFLSVDEPPRVLMISSALPGEGKTTLTVNLALTLADAGRTVTVVEADLRRPRLTRYLGLVAGAGLTNVLAGTAEIDDVLQTYGDGRLSVIAAGPTPPNPGELLASSHMSEFLGKLLARTDYVLLDAPPLAAGSQTPRDSPCTQTAHSSRSGTGKLAPINSNRQQSRWIGLGAKTLGIILNFVPPRADSAAAYGYGYEYRSAAQSVHGPSPPARRSSSSRLGTRGLARTGPRRHG